jgi:hypothetical protein
LYFVLLLKKQYEVSCRGVYGAVVVEVEEEQTNASYTDGQQSV